MLGCRGVGQGSGLPGGGGAGGVGGAGAVAPAVAEGNAICSQSLCPQASRLPPYAVDWRGACTRLRTNPQPYPLNALPQVSPIVGLTRWGRNSAPGA